MNPWSTFSSLFKYYLQNIVLQIPPQIIKSSMSVYFCFCRVHFPKKEQKGQNTWPWLTQRSPLWQTWGALTQKRLSTGDFTPVSNTPSGTAFIRMTFFYDVIDKEWKCKIRFYFFLPNGIQESSLYILYPIICMPFSKRSRASCSLFIWQWPILFSAMENGWRIFLFMHNRLTTSFHTRTFGYTIKSFILDSWVFGASKHVK